jgi:addiction module HigA family antidote
MKPAHPGQTLLNFLEPCGITQNALARRMGVPPRRINEIVLGKRSITADTAIGLAEVLGTTELFWMRLQADYDLAVARSRRPPRPPVPDWDSFSDYYDEWDALSDRAREHNMEAQQLAMDAERLVMTRDVTVDISTRRKK